ncbi:MAG TPA: ATP-binding protein [Acidilobales archaeon]|nr:ATP-binding protein [Acidilobales archaeon]
MLFDIRPKRRRKDLYNFDEEYRKLTSSLGKPLIVVRGLRRTGKTSLILTALEESKVPYILFDLRGYYKSRKELYESLSRGITDFMRRSSLKKRVLDLLRSALMTLRGVSIHGVNVSLSWGRSRASLIDLFRGLDYFALKSGLKVIIVFDEVQKLSGPLKVEVCDAISYAFDYMEGLSFILSGSEMGVLYGLLNNPQSSLYGRAYIEVVTRRLMRDESLDFLRKGFSELGINVSDDELVYVVDKLNGIIGWLTYYGYLRSHGYVDVNEILKKAVEMAKQELMNFINYRVSRRYKLILKALAQGIKEWRELKRYIEKAEGREVSNRVIHDIIHQLIKHSIIDNELNFMDQVLREAALAL